MPGCSRTQACSTSVHLALLFCCKSRLLRAVHSRNRPPCIRSPCCRPSCSLRRRAKCPDVLARKRAVHPFTWLCFFVVKADCSVRCTPAIAPCIRSPCCCPSCSFGRRAKCPGISACRHASCPFTWLCFFVVKADCSVQCTPAIAPCIRSPCCRPSCSFWRRAKCPDVLARKRAVHPFTWLCFYKKSKRFS